MTKDLALLISRDAPYLNTEDFLAALDRRLETGCRTPPDASSRATDGRKQDRTVLFSPIG